MKKEVGFVLKPLPALLAGLLLGAPLAHADGAVDLGSVSAQGTSSNGTSNNADTTNSSTVWNTQQKQNSSQDVQSITPDQIQLFGPDAGGMQSLSIMPNTLISGYNAGSVSSRSTISMRGIKVGWNSVPGDLQTNGITAELDGVPLNSLSQGTGWHSPEIPIGALMAGVNTINGPGNADTRWYNTLGGSINFIPVQPSAQASANAELSVGSFDTLVASFVLNTGEHDGWSTVLGAANARSQTFRTTSDYLPSRTTDAYIKTQKRLDNGLISFGLYGLYNDEYRPNMIPTTAQPGITMNGIGIPGPAYSQQTAGYYATLPTDMWFKHNSIEDYLGWSHLELNLAPDFTLSNVMWFRDGYVNHFRMNNYDYAGVGTNEENFNERSNTYGDKLQFDEHFSKSNVFSFGGYVISSRAESAYTGYLSALGFNNSQPGSIQYNTTQTTDWALFAQDSATLFDRLNIVPAFRLVDFQTDFANNSPNAASTYYPGGIPGSVSYDTNPNQSTTFVKGEPSLGLNYKIDDALNFYGNYAIAYSNPTAGNYDRYPENIATLQPIRSTNWDIGLRYAQKNVFGLDQLSGTIGYFNTLLDNQTIPRTVTGSIVTTFGSGSATLEGEELEINADINRNWSAFANLGWLTATWNSYYSGTTGQYYNGMPVSNSPEQTTNVGVTYEAYVPGGTIDTTLWDQYFGKSYMYDNLTGAPSSQVNPAYNLVNLSINAHLTSIGWLQSLLHPQVATLSLDVQNLLDTQYNSTAYISAGGYFGTSYGGYVIANPGAPRSFFVTLRLDY